MKKEFVFEVILKAGGVTLVREWGYSAGDAWQRAKKLQDIKGSYRSVREA